MEQIIQPQQQKGNQPLSPAEIKRHEELRQTAFILGLVSATIILLSLVSWGLNWSKSNQIKSLNQTITAKKQSLEKNFSALIERQSLVKEQLSIFQEMTADEVDYRKELLEELSNRAVKGVRLMSLSLKENKVEIEGQAKTFSAVAQQIMAWRQSKYFKQVTLLAANNLEDGKKQFSASFNFKPTHKKQFSQSVNKNE